MNSLEEYVRLWSQAPSIQNQEVFKWTFSLTDLFFKSNSLHKNWRGGSELLLLKNGTIDSCNAY